MNFGIGLLEDLSRTKPTNILMRNKGGTAEVNINMFLEKIKYYDMALMARFSMIEQN